MCRRGRACLKYKFILNFIKNIQKNAKKPILNWRTIGGTTVINGQKLLKCSNYSPMLNICRKGRAHLK